MKINVLLFLGLMSIILIACNDDPDPDPMPTTCETEGLTYSLDISTILDSNCATSGCHEMASTTTFEMHNYETTKAAVEFGRIVGAINHEEGFVPMPFPAGTDMLEQCEIDRMTQWINDGAPE